MGFGEPSHRIASLAGQLCDAGYGLGLRGTGPVEIAPAAKAHGDTFPVLICMSMKKQGMSFVVLPDQNAAASSLRNLANPLIADNCGSSR